MGLLDLVSDASDAGKMVESSTKERRQSETIEVTPAALNEIRRLKNSENWPAGHGLRLGVKGGGCSGLSYDLKSTGEREGDHVLRFDELKIFVDPKSYVYLKGIELDHEGGLKGKGFVFKNPNASSSCGCGESFSV